MSTKIIHIGTRYGTQDGTQAILELISENSQVTRKEMAKRLSISIRTLQRMLNNMPNVHYVGTGVNGHWEIDEKMHREEINEH